MAEQNDDAPKIFVDDDWKEQARREQAQQDEATRDVGGDEEMPEPSILEIVNLLAMQATVGLGLMQDPRTGRPLPPHLPTARHFIDLLALLADKTKGKLDEEEQQVLDRTLHELRLIFVEIKSHAAGGAGESDEGAPGTVTGD
jgi:hypothetical protein